MRLNWIRWFLGLCYSLAGGILIANEIGETHYFGHGLVLLGLLLMALSLELKR